MPLSNKSSDLFGNSPRSIILTRTKEMRRCSRKSMRHIRFSLPKRQERNMMPVERLHLTSINKTIGIKVQEQGHTKNLINRKERDIKRLKKNTMSKTLKNFENIWGKGMKKIWRSTRINGKTTTIWVELMITMINSERKPYKRKNKNSSKRWRLLNSPFEKQKRPTGRLRSNNIKSINKNLSRNPKKTLNFALSEAFRTAKRRSTT